MARNPGATKEEVEAILAKYKQSGLTRREHCVREGITVYMLDYYQRRLCKLKERESAKQRATAAVRPERRQSARTPTMARVVIDDLLPNTPAAAATGFAMTSASGNGQSINAFALTLAKGRRLEAAWNFDERELTRLIRAVEAA